MWTSRSHSHHASLSKTLTPVPTHHRRTSSGNDTVISQLPLSGIVPRDPKTAVVEKAITWHNDLLKNYRPSSNLPFLSKILEKVVLHKLLSYLQENNLSNPFQSAYRAGHSTETVLLPIAVNDILSAMNNDNISALLLLDFLPLSLTLLTTKFSSPASVNYVFGIQSTVGTPMVSLTSQTEYQSTSVNK